jgi:hypothetical protein
MLGWRITHQMADEYPFVGLSAMVNNLMEN